jgi:DNA-binding PadR family transcriptional regulator
MQQDSALDTDWPMALNVFAGFVELHILYHASQSPVYGLWLIEELRRHRYRISPGTLYPVLHSMTASDLLVVRDVLTNGKIRKYYSITAKGRRHFAKAKRQLSELVREVFHDEDLRLLVSPLLQRSSRTAARS